jgi:PPOX class probable F420-dependent enzyme
MEMAEMRRRVGGARVGRLATAGPGGQPHVVPVCFVLDRETIYFAIDAKPKQTRALKRLRNIAANPAVAFLVDHYENDWTKLWWVRVDGRAVTVAPGAESERAIDLLAGRYEQYLRSRPDGPVVGIAIERWSGWSSE